MQRLAAAFALLIAALPADADEHGLLGRKVIFHVRTWDDAAAPYLISRDYIGIVGTGPEFGMQREGFSGLDVVPVLIDVSANGIVFSYEIAHQGVFAIAKFNGYILQFPTECVLIADAAIDLAATTLALKPDV